MEPLLLHQVTSKPEGSTIGQEDHALSKAITSPVYVRLLHGCSIWRLQVGLVGVHKAPLLPQTSNCTNVVQGLTRNLQTEDTSLD